MSDMRRPSSVPSEDYYTKSRMTNARTRSRSASIQGDSTPLTLASFITSNRSLFILSERNIIRRFCKKIVESKPFEYFILLTILVNCILLAANTPLPKDDKSDTNVRIDNAEIYLLAIFCLECVLKVIALGFALHPGSYLRSGWNMLDFTVVVTGYFGIRKNAYNHTTASNSTHTSMLLHGLAIPHLNPRGMNRHEFEAGGRKPSD